jgi:signal transduction histidine kinase
MMLEMMLEMMLQLMQQLRAILKRSAGSGIGLWIRERLPRKTTLNLPAQLLLMNLVLVVFSLGGLILFTGQHLSAQIVDRHEHDLQLHAENVADVMADPWDNLQDGKLDAQTVIARLVGSDAQSTGPRVLLMDPDLTVFQSSDSRVPLRTEPEGDEIRAARAGIPQPTIRWDEWSKEERLYVAEPLLKDGDQTIGFVQLSVPTAPMRVEILGAWMGLLGLGGAVLLATLLTSILLARHIADPVRQLTATSEQIAAGCLTGRVSPAGPDEVQRLGLAFNRMAERVQAMMTQQQMFVDNAAHELRSPLTTLRLHLDLVRARQPEGDEKTVRSLGQMEREIDYLQRMVGQLLALSIVVDREQAVPKSSLDLARLLYELADDMQAVIQLAGLTLTMEVPPHLPPVDANAEQMTIMLRNLLDNAVKYTRAGGTVTLAASPGDHAIEIRIADTGIGISPSALPHIFDRFYRVDQAHSRHSATGNSGAGLGLALVHSVVQAHGGDVRVMSRIDEGTTFVVTLPIRTGITSTRANGSQRPSEKVVSTN